MARVFVERVIDGRLVAVGGGNLGHWQFDALLQAAYGCDPARAKGLTAAPRTVAGHGPVKTERDPQWNSVGQKAESSTLQHFAPPAMFYKRHVWFSMRTPRLPGQFDFPSDLSCDTSHQCSMLHENMRRSLRTQTCKQRSEPPAVSRGTAQKRTWLPAREGHPFRPAEAN